MSGIVDLSMPLQDGMRGFTYEQVKTADREGWNTSNLHIYSHAGTHMDAQLHFEAGPGTIDQIPLERCMGPAWIIDLEGIADKELITVGHLGEVSKKFLPGECLLFRTSWSRHVNSPQHYRDHFPRISDELACWCADHRVNLIGVEPPSVADMNNKEELTRIHKTLLGANIIIVEGLTNLDALSHDKVFFVAAPLKIQGGDGCPCRAYAFDGIPPEFIPMPLP
ncbi:MAG: cyclase family protein [Verrucomicrobiae bacterium]|nr:cyclase family protein [Verrucomicrobiae bacterium]